MSTPAPGGEPMPALDDTDARIAAIETALDQADAMVTAICHGVKRWTMCIPAQPETDSDLVISRGLACGRVALTALRESRAECSRLRATLNGTASALDASEQERRILIDHAAALSATLDAREAERARLYGIVEEAIVGVEHGWTNTQALTFRERCRTALPSRAAASLSEEPNP